MKTTAVTYTKTRYIGILEKEIFDLKSELANARRYVQDLKALREVDHEIIKNLMALAKS